MPSTVSAAGATTEPEADSTRRSSLQFPVVGIGASAGGLQAVKRLLEHLPAAPGMAFVVVLHLSPEHESHAAEVLQRSTPLPVLQVAQTVPIEVDRVYVIAPALQLSMDDSQLVVSPTQGPRGRPGTIDIFFRTLARAHRERSVAVVLSGTGSDGTVGLADVKGEGGVTLVQTPADAEYPAMPDAAISGGHVDFQLPADEIAFKLVELWQNAQCMRLPDADEAGLQVRNETDAGRAQRAEAALADVMAILAARTGNDFRHYKRGTVLRRLERRMQVTRQPDLPAYRHYLEAHPQESQLLLQDMLISVTHFFRDPRAFESMERELVAQLFEHHPPPAAVRAWSVGCASGEEAYALAMLINDHLPTTVPPVAVQVFASDVDERALGVARAGLYPEAIAADVAPVRLRRFFDKEGHGYRVKKALREQLLFTRHNVLSDPPFSRLDIITCRNLLMYLERGVQSRVLELLHFALRPGGLLLLGGAESADTCEELFSVVDKRHRLYRAKPRHSARANLALHAVPALPQAMPVSLRAPSGEAVAVQPLAQLHQRLLDGSVPASVTIDAQYNVLHLGTGASRYLRFVDGPPSQSLLDILLPELSLALRPALLRAAATQQRVGARPVVIGGEQRPITLLMSVHLMPGGHPAAQMLVRFDEIDELQLPQDDGAAGDPAHAVLDAEIRRLRTELHEMQGDSAASTEALRASNEELQSINEELRSATEELETSKEELQSVNEELITVNFELKQKVEETAKANDDLSNLITSMNMATVFVDREMRIKGFTPLASNVFKLLPADVGRPLQDLRHRLLSDTIAADVERVVTTLQAVEREVAADDGRWYLMRVTAYRTVEDRIDGAVLNFIDTTERRRAQEQVRSHDERLRLVAESTRDYAVVTLDGAGTITGWNKGAEFIFGHDAADVQGQHFRLLFTPEDQAADVPARELRLAREHGRTLDERWHLRKDGSRFYASGITTPLGEDGCEGFAKIARDLTDRQLLERQREDLLAAEQQVRQRLEAADALRSEFLAVMSHELKNPLNLVLMNAELIGRSGEAMASAPVMRAVNLIRRTVQAQAKIIDDLLDLSRIDTGKLTLARAAVQWAPALQRIVDAMRGDADAKGVAVSLQAEPLVVFADPVRVDQIVWNLLNNALKFTPAGGAIHVRLSRDGACAVLEVQDTGRGIDAALLPRVFDMFEQGGVRAATRPEGGLGIGLALVKQLAERQGGSVHAQSAGKDRGATFQVKLPLFEGATGQDGDAHGPGGRLLAGRRMLLVDDSADTLEVLAALLTAEGAQVRTARSGQEALACARDGDHDVVISDIAMPEMDGLQFIAALRQQSGARRCAAIAVSGFGRPEDVKRSLAAGFDAHLAKPLSLDELAGVLVRLGQTRSADA